MLDTKKEEIVERNNVKREIEAIDGEKNKVSYLANQKDNEAKLEFLKNFTEKESRAKIINSLEHKVSPDLFKIVYLAQRMIKEFLRSTYINIPDDKSEIVEIIFNSTNIIFNKLSENENLEVDNKNKIITISEKRKTSQNKLLAYVLHGYAYCFSNREGKENNCKLFEEGNANIFVDLVISNYIKNHPYENVGFHLDRNSSNDKFIEEDSELRTRMYVLEKLKMDKKMILEYLLGDKEKYLKNIFNGEQRREEFNIKEFYDKNKFALKDIDKESIYYSKNAILPLYILQNNIVNQDILDKEYNATEIIKKYFSYQRINKINTNKLNEIISIMMDTNKIKMNLEDFINDELKSLTEMEKRMSSANILENILTILNYQKLSDETIRQMGIIIQYLINDLERTEKLENGNELLQKINKLSGKISIDDKSLQEEINDNLSYLEIKLEMISKDNLTPEVFFNRLKNCLKFASKIERNEELIAYQTIKDELNLSKK